MIPWKSLPALALLIAAPLVAQPFRDMDYGPFLTMSVEVAPKNIAQKAICIRLDDGAGGVAKGNAFVAFETDTLRYAAAWTGDGFIDWRGIAFNGAHNAHPKIVGHRTYANPTAPGWAKPGTDDFKDTRVRGLDQLAYGPLPRDWGHWKGLRQLGRRVILHYEVGDRRVLELPGLIDTETRAFSRAMELAPHGSSRLIQIAESPSTATTTVDATSLEPAASDESAGSRIVIVPVENVVVATNDQLVLGATDYTISAWVRTRQGGSIFSKAPANGPWVAKGKTLFVRGGRLGFDVGWVGAVEGRTRVADGKWHHVAMTHRGSDGHVTLYVDGKEDGDGALPSEDGQKHVVRIGYTATTFMPAFKGAIDDVRVFRRRLSASDIRKAAGGATVARPEASWSFEEGKGNRAANAVDAGLIAHLDGTRFIKGRSGRALRFDGSAQVRIGDRFKAGAVAPKEDEGDKMVLAIAVAGGGGPDLRWHLADGHVRLHVPASDTPRRQTVLQWRGMRRDLEKFAALVAATTSTPDLSAAWNTDAPTRRPQRVATTAKRVHDDGPFAVEELTLPNDNPWKSWIRLGGFDFFDDHDRAAVASWQGDVWIVTGLRDLDSDTPTLTWQCIATGLYQPLGLRIKNGEIYVLGRDQITHLVDRNGDGETDVYENFNNDAQVTEHFHEFAMDLQTDAAGNFYYMKGARHAKTGVVPHHGTLIKVSSDGARSEVIASGFRAPNGLSVNDDGSFFTSDQEGHWTPMNRINHVVKGGFYGNMMGYCPERTDTSHDQPLCWIHKNTDRSPAAQLWAKSPSWGVLNGALLSLSYGTGRIWNVLHEKIGDTIQGGVVQLPLPEFPTGIQRGRFHEKDGQLYVCGLFGWSSNKTRPGGFFRVSRTREPLDLPTSLNAVPGGVVLGFSSPLDPASATEARRYRVERWNYKRTRSYGSRDYKVSDGERGRDKVPVLGVKLSADGRSVFLQLPDMGPVMQMEIQYKIRSAAGADLVQKVHHTIHKLGDGSNVSASFDGGLAIAGAGAPTDADLRSGLELHVQSLLPGRQAEQTRTTTRLAALRVGPDGVPSPFVTRGRFNATWTGFIDVDSPGTYQLHAETSGFARISVGDREVLVTTAANQRPIAVAGQPLELLAGPTPIRIEVASNDQGQVDFRLLWSGRGFPTEPVPPTVLRHTPNAALASHLQIDRGRTSFAEHGCVRCHQLPAGHDELHPTTMPELGTEAPALDGLGSRLERSWMFEWMLEPGQWQRHPTMPDLFPNDDPDARGDAADIAAWLSGQTAPTPITADLPGVSVEAGRVLYEDLGCISCHTFEPPSKKDAHDRHSLRFAAAKFRSGALGAYLESPRARHPWGRMPDFALDPQQAASLARFIRSRSHSRIRPAAELEHGDKTRGKAAFVSRGCGACHRVGTDPLARPPEVPALGLGKDVATGCVADRVPAAAADYGFNANERADLRAFMTADDGASLQRTAAHAAAERAITSANCTACHDRDDAHAPRLDLLLADGRTDMAPEVLPSLTWAGEKLRAPWTEKLLSGGLPYRARPWMKARMPAFPNRARVIARGLPHGHGISLDEPVRPAIEPDVAMLGKRLSATEGGFNCTQCHGVGALAAFGPFGDRGVNFTHISDRLRHDFYTRWMLAPHRVDPRTKMPSFSPDGKKTVITGLLEGNADAQFDALWMYLRSKPRSSRAFVREWTMEDLAPGLDGLAGGRSFAKGQQLYKTLACSQCHQVNGAGGTIGPDLTTIAEKHQPLAMLEEVLLPSKTIEDKYRTHTIFTKDDEMIDGMLIGEDARSLEILTNPLDPKSVVTVKKSNIDERRVSAVSPMPDDLLNTLKESEILDLLAFIRSGGNPDHGSFKN